MCHSIPHQIDRSFDSRLPKRGEIIIDKDGLRQKYDGHSWRLVCANEKCPRIARKHGVCKVHSTSTRKRSPLRVPVPVPAIPQEPPAVVQAPIPVALSPPPIPRSNSLEVNSLKKGDVQLVRQQWNGTKWYSLCHCPTETCSRRSAGVKYHHLCHPHYKEYLDRQKTTDTRGSSTLKSQRRRGNYKVCLLFSPHQCL